MEWLRKTAMAAPYRKALCTVERSYSYEELYHAVMHKAHELRDSLKDQQRLAVLSDNSASMAVYILACMLLHKEVLLLNVHLKKGEIDAQLSALGISVVITTPERVQSVDRQDLDGHDVILMDTVLDLSPTADDFDWSFQDDEIAAVMNTSATTGTFKSVPLRWGQIKAHVAASQQVLGAEDSDNWLVVLPLFHVSGLSIMMRSLYNGTAITVLERYDEAEVLELIQSKSVTLISLVPTVLKSLLPKIQTHALRVILLGGEYIPDPLIDACVKANLPVYKTYGMTETFSQSVTFPVSAYPDKRASVGRPLPGMTVRIDRPDRDGVGEIHLSGPMVMSGYCNREPLGGEFNTDDIGRLDEDGFLYVLNRRKDLIISGGENIYPKELEDMVYSMGNVRECAVIPVDDERWGQVPALFVVLHADETGRDTCAGSSSDWENRILRYMGERLAKYKVPKYVRIVEALPRNGTGKILRGELHIDK